MFAIIQSLDSLSVLGPSQVRGGYWKYIRRIYIHIGVNIHRHHRIYNIHNRGEYWIYLHRIYIHIEVNETTGYTIYIHTGVDIHQDIYEYRFGNNIDIKTYGG